MTRNRKKQFVEAGAKLLNARPLSDFELDAKKLTSANISQSTKNNYVNISLEFRTHLRQTIYSYQRKKLRI